MTGVWPWLAVAGVGALHGCNPATGWGLAAALGVRGGGRAHAWRALAPIAIGHAASVGLIAVLATLGLVAQRGLLPWLAGGLAVFVAAVHVSGHLPQRLDGVAAQAGLTLWSLTMGIAHGAGMMLVPALIPLCLSGSPAREITASGSMALALAAVAVHMAAMLAVTGTMAALACRGWGLYRRRAHRAAWRGDTQIDVSAMSASWPATTGLPARSRPCLAPGRRDRPSMPAMPGAARVAARPRA